MTEAMILRHYFEVCLVSLHLCSVKVKGVRGENHVELCEGLRDAVMVPGGHRRFQTLVAGFVKCGLHSGRPLLEEPLIYSQSQSVCALLWVLHPDSGFERR